MFTRDYANTVELVFIKGHRARAPRPEAGTRGSLAGPVRTEEITSGGADNFIWRPKHVLHTPNLQRTDGDAHGGATAHRHSGARSIPLHECAISLNVHTR